MLLTIQFKRHPWRTLLTKKFTFAIAIAAFEVLAWNRTLWYSSALSCVVFVRWALGLFKVWSVPCGSWWSIASLMAITAACTAQENNKQTNKQTETDMRLSRRLRISPPENYYFPNSYHNLFVYLVWSLGEGSLLKDCWWWLTFVTCFEDQSHQNKTDQSKPRPEAIAYM